jgi:uncharacterized protein DUF2418
MTCLLIIAASLNTLFLFTHTKLYHLFLQPDPVASSHARFVSVPTNPPVLASRMRAHTWGLFLASWRFLLGITPSSSSPGSGAYGGTRVQELEVWTPGEGELMLLCVYSPVHAFLWMLWNAGNWIMMAAVMVGVSFQVRTIIFHLSPCLITLLSNLFILLGTCLDDDLRGIAQRPNDHCRRGFTRI